MSTINDLDPDALISRLAGPLSPPNRGAFRAAAEDALNRVPCWGAGAVSRAVIPSTRGEGALCSGPARSSSHIAPRWRYVASRSTASKSIAPRLREQRRSRGRRITVTPALFPGYAFVLIVS